jgi:hypothetical protein
MSFHTAVFAQVSCPYLEHRLQSILDPELRLSSADAFPLKPLICWASLTIVGGSKNFAGGSGSGSKEKLTSL